MATTAAIHSQSPRANGGTYTSYEFTHVESGLQWESGSHHLEAGADAQAIGDSLAPRHEVMQSDAELERAWQVGSTGGDLDTEVWYFHTLAQVQKYFFRRLFNLMRDAEEDPDKALIAVAMSEPTSYMNKYNAAATSGFIDDPAWNTPTTNSARTKISAVGVNVAQLDHGEAELSLAV